MSQAISDSHQWVGAVTVPLSDGLAKQADRRGTARIPQSTKVEVLEVYCGQCRRPFDRVAGQTCEAAANRDHLIGGPTGERKKRGHADDEAAEAAESIAHQSAATG